jgi:hypothetical protein
MVLQGMLKCVRNCYGNGLIPQLLYHLARVTELCMREFMWHGSMHEYVRVNVFEGSSVPQMLGACPQSLAHAGPRQNGVHCPLLEGTTSAPSCLCGCSSRSSLPGRECCDRPPGLSFQDMNVASDDRASIPADVRRNRRLLYR